MPAQNILAKDNFQIATILFDRCRRDIIRNTGAGDGDDGVISRNAEVAFSNGGFSNIQLNIRTDDSISFRQHVGDDFRNADFRFNAVCGDGERIIRSRETIHKRLSRLNRIAWILFGSQLRKSFQFCWLKTHRSNVGEAKVT